MNLKSRAFQALHRIDFLSPKIGFEHNSNSNFNSTQGFIYSTFIILLTAIIGGMFSQDFYLRQNPKVIASQETITESPISLAKFPILFTSALNNVIIGEGIFNFVDVDFVYFAVSPDLNITRIVYTDNVFKKCDFSDYDLDDNQMATLIKSTVQSMLCLNHRNLSFKNPYSEPNSAFVNIRFKRCSNPGIGSCPKNIDSLLQSISISIGFLDPYTDSKSYSTPVQNRFTFNTLILSQGFLKRLFFQFRNDIYYSDYGWILETMRIYEYYALQDISSDYIINNDPQSTLFNHSYWATFSSSILRQRTYRSYMKVQELFATIGGFARFICIVVKFMTESHLRFVYLLFLREMAISESSTGGKGKKINIKK